MAAIPGYKFGFQRMEEPFSHFLMPLEHIVQRFVLRQFLFLQIKTDALIRNRTPPIFATVTDGKMQLRAVREVGLSLFCSGCDQNFRLRYWQMVGAAKTAYCMLQPLLDASGIIGGENINAYHM